MIWACVTLGRTWNTFHTLCTKSVCLHSSLKSNKRMSTYFIWAIRAIIISITSPSGSNTTTVGTGKLIHGAWTKCWCMINKKFKCFNQVIHHLPMEISSITVTNLNHYRILNAKYCHANLNSIAILLRFKSSWILIVTAKNYLSREFWATHTFLSFLIKSHNHKSQNILIWKYERAEFEKYFNVWWILTVSSNLLICKNI